MKPETKICKTCGKEKFLRLDFYIGSDCADGYRLTCKACERKEKKQQRADKPKPVDADDTTVDYFLRDDYKKMRTAVIARVQRSVKGLSLRELRIFVQNKRLIDDGKLYLYLESILKDATRSGEIDEICGLASRWRKVPAAKVIKARKVEKIDHRTTNSQLFGKVARQVNPFAESVYSKV
jgi:hypothetical protein